MKRFAYRLLFSFLLLSLPVEVAFAFHVPPWDTGHQSFDGDDGDSNTDPGNGNGCNGCPCTQKAMSPVEAATGNFSTSLRVIRVPSFGPAIDISLTYNSEDLRIGPAGLGWVHTFDQRIIETTDAVQLYAICARSNGKRETFVRNSDGSYNTPSYLRMTLVKNQDATFSLQDKYGTTTSFGIGGSISGIRDRNGNQLTFEYDNTGFLLTITDVSKRKVTFTKGPDGHIASITDPDGKVFRLTYDTAGRLTRYADRNNDTTTFTYDNSGNLTTITDGRGNVQTALTYDSSGRVAQWKDRSETWQFIYSPAAKKTTKRDSAGNIWTFEYNENGNITKVTDPLGKTEQYVVDSGLNVTQYTNKNSASPRYAYDTAGNRLSVTDPLSNTKLYSYEDSFSRVTEARDRRGNSTKFSYDSHGNLTQMLDSTGKPMNFAYDARGQLLNIRDALSQLYSFQYDDFGNITDIIDPLSNVTHSSFDTLGRLLKQADANGHSGQFTYDANDRLLSTVRDGAGVVLYDYDSSGNLTGVTNAAGKKVTFAYDTFNRLITVTDALGRSTRYTYAAHGKVATKTDANGKTISYNYDALDRLVKKSRPEDSVTYTYDAVGNLTSVVDGDSSISFAYDALNRPIQASTLATSAQRATTIRYSYDADGNRISLLDPSGNTTRYQYDERSRMTSLSDPSGQTFTFTYDGLSRRIGMNRPTGSLVYSYDNASRVTGISYSGAAGPNALSYSYDKANNRTTQVDIYGSHVFSYDAAEHLIGVSHSGSSQAEAYVYDEINNRTASHLSPSYLYDAAGELQSDGKNQYLYDANGNRVQKKDINSGAITRYGYNSDNQMIHIDFPDGGVADYQYDGLGRRIQKIVRGQTTQYVYDRDNVLLEYENGVLTREYTRGPGADELLSIRRGGRMFLVEADASASIIRLTEGATVQASYRYDAFGNVVAESGSRQSPYGFQGRELDDESGLYYFRARYYDPQLGAFLQQDPLIGPLDTASIYTFCEANPVNCSDPNGLLSTFDAFWHYFFGKGTSLTVPFNEVDVGLQPTDFPGFLNLTNAVKGGGGMSIALRSVRDVFSKAPWAGHVTFQLSGDLHGDDCGWEFEGTIAAFSDVFDFDKKPWGVRKYWAEVITRLFGYLPGGTPYRIDFSGNREVSAFGSYGDAACQCVP